MPVPMKSEAAAILLADLPGRADQRYLWARFVYAVVALLAAAGIFACWCDTPMIWDGAYQFSFSLILHKPYSYLTRFHSYILWTPMVLLSHLTTNLAVLKMAYGLPFTLAPAASVLLSWCVVRRRAPHLILWAIFGAAAGPLPGQIFIINDSIFQQHMFWPVFLGMLVPLRPPQIVLLPLLAVFQFSHQIGLVLLGGGAMAAALLALRDRENRRELLLKSAIAAALAAIALWKIIHFPDSYARQEFTWERAHLAWQYGVEGYPLHGQAFMWAGALLVLFFGLLRPRQRMQRVVFAVSTAAMVLAAAVTWVLWARDPKLWADAVNYRRWVVPLTLPFYLLAFLDAWATVPSQAIEPSLGLRRPVGYAVACTFVLVLSIQSLVWLKLTHILMAKVASHPAGIVPWRDVAAGADGTAIDHWGTSSFVFVLEGRVPRHLLLDHFAARQQLQVLRHNPPMIPLAPFTPIKPAPTSAGGFDFRPLLTQIQTAPTASRR